MSSARSGALRSARSILDDALSIFGAGRLVFASDYPMLLRFATYRDWVAAVEHFLAAQGLSEDDVAAIFSGNALRANPLLRAPNTNRAAAHSATHGTHMNIPEHRRPA